MSVNKQIRASVRLFVAISPAILIKPFTSAMWPLQLLVRVHKHWPLYFTHLFGNKAFFPELESVRNVLPLGLVTYLARIFFTELLGWESNLWCSQGAETFFR